MPLTVLSVALSLIVTLLALLHPGVATSQTESCATSGAVENAVTKPGLLSDCMALLAARDKLAGHASLNWSASTPIGQWEGLTLGESPLRVTQLKLGYRELTGEIPSELGELSRLAELYLHGNDLAGAIPGELGSLSELQVLHLAENDLTGPIPDELSNLAKLTRLDLSYNDLNGVVPSWLGSLTELRALNLSTNELTGGIPPEMGSLSKLQYLSLEYNMLQGIMPGALGRLTDLEYLDLDGNDLTGRIPSELGGLSKLRQLQLSENEFTGDIPISLAALLNLESLSLSVNNFTGEIPAQLGDLSGLFVLDLGGNRLTGTIPAELGKLANLRSLSLDGNHLTGSIPVWLGNLSSLRSLSLGSNRLTGRIPDELAGLHYLDTLFLGNNQLEGQVPAWLGELANLRLLYLNENLFTGELPAALADLTNLESLSVADNDLTGCVPAALSRVHRLVVDNTGLQFCLEQDDDRPAVSALLTVGEGEELLIDASVALPAKRGAEGEVFEVSSVGHAVNGAVRLEGTTIIYVHDGSETTTGGFTYTLSAGANTSTGVVTITVRPINDPPVAVGDTAAVDEGETLSIEAPSLLANDFDVEGGALRVLEVRNARSGTVRLHGTTITYVHDGSETTSGSFTYVVSDGVDSSTGLVTITVRPVNDPPVAVSDSVVVNEGDTLLIEAAELLANDGEAEGDRLEVSAVGDVVSGTVDLAGTTITYVHDGSETMSGSFKYTVSDGVSTSTGLVTITVRPVNDTPIAVGDRALVNEGEMLLIEAGDLLANDSDAEGDAMQVSAVSDAANGTVDLAGTTITYVHDGSETTSGSFTYMVSDGVDSSTGLVTITVRPVNDPPVAVSDSVVVNEGGTLLIEAAELLANDGEAEGDRLEVSAVGDVVSGTVDLAGTTITYVHDGSETMSGSFKYTVSDGVSTSTGLVTITVNPVNDPPVAVGDIAVVNLGEMVVIEESDLLINDSDAEQDTLTISAVGEVVDGTVTFGDSIITYVHDGSEAAIGGFTYTVTDGEDNATARVDITVSRMNETPTATADSSTTKKDEKSAFETPALVPSDQDTGNSLRVVPLIVLALGVGLVAAVTLAVVMALRRHRRSPRH